MPKNLSRMAVLLPIVFLILFTERGKAAGEGNGLTSLLPIGMQGWWGKDTTGTPRDMYVLKGSSIVLSCQIPQLQRLLEHSISSSSNSFVNITWLKDNEPYLNKRSFVTSQGQLNITKLLRRRSRSYGVADDGEYRCLLRLRSDIPWIISAPPIRLHVADLSRTINVPTNVSLHKGEVLSLRCQIESEPAAQYNWVRIPEPLPQDNRISQFQNSNSGVLQIMDFDHSHAGTYRCIATNPLTKKSRESNLVEVKVKDEPPPTFLTPNFLPFPNWESPIVIPEGGQASMECVATGLPAPTIKWQRKITSQDQLEIIDVDFQSGKFSLFGASNLRLSGASLQHSGVYICKATSFNPVSQSKSVISQEFTLKVVKAPEIVNGLKNITTLLAKTVRLNCSYSDHLPGVAPPQISWYKNGFPLVTDARVKIFGDNQLIFINSISKDTGIYQCLIQNKAGFASSWSSLLVNSSQDNPYPPQNLRYVLLTTTEVALTWDPVEIPGSEIQAYSVHFTRLGEDLTEYQEVSENNELMLRELIPHTNYSVNVRAFTALSGSDPSKTLLITMADDVPLVAPEFHLRPLNATSLIVTWSPIPPKKARGTVVQYKIQWMRKIRAYYNINEVNGDVFEDIVPELQPERTYRVRVTARTAAGYNEGADFPWKSITMPKIGARIPEDLPSAPNLEMFVSGEIKKNINVTWSMPPEDSGVVTGFVLKYKKVDGTWSKNINLPSNATQYIIRNLDPDQYRVKIYASTYDGIGDAASQTIDTQIKIFSDKLESGRKFPAIEQVKLTLVSDTIVSLAWKLRKSRDQEVRFYTINQRVIGEAADKEPPVLQRVTRNFILINDLNPEFVYEFRIRAHMTANEFGEYSNPIRTDYFNDKIKPSSSTEVAVVSLILESVPVDASTIEIKWQAKKPVVKYQLIFTREHNLPHSNWHMEEVDGNNHSWQIPGLVSNTEYWFKIRSCSNGECGSFSEPLKTSIPAILPPDGMSSKAITILTVILTTCLFCILVIGVIVCVLRYRNLHSMARAPSCNGHSGNVSTKHGDRNSHVGRNGAVADINGSDGDYIPMLNRIHTDLPMTPLDTKGGYPNIRINGFANHRINGVVQGKEAHFVPAVNVSKPVDCEESEHLFNTSTAPSAHPLLQTNENLSGNVPNNSLNDEKILDKNETKSSLLCKFGMNSNTTLIDASSKEQRSLCNNKSPTISA